MPKLSSNFLKYLVNLDKAVKKGTADWEKLVKASSQELTPKDTGALRESYLASIEPKVGLGVKYTIKYGNGLVGDSGKNYAAEVHEWPDDKNWTTPGTGPRFLERALWENSSDLIRRVKAEAMKIK